MQLRKLIQVAFAFSVIALLVFTPVTGYALQRSPNEPSIVVLDGRTEPPISVSNSRLQRAPNSPGNIVLDGHPEPPISVSIGRWFTVVSAVGLRVAPISGSREISRNGR